MILTNYCDKGELRKFLGNYADTRFDDYLLEKAVLKASDEIQSALRPSYKVNYFALSSFSDSTLNGIATATGTNTITDSSRSWTINEFNPTTIGFNVEVLIWNGSSFYIADVVSNTATALTISSIDGASLSIAINDIYYLRRKNPSINSMAINLSAYHFFASSRLSRGIQNIQEICDSLKTAVYQELSEYKDRLRDFGYIAKTDSITLNGYEWQSLTYNQIVPLSETVTKSLTTYKSFQGYEIDYEKGLIRQIDSSHSTYLSSDDTISVAYSVSLCQNGGYAYGY